MREPLSRDNLYDSPIQIAEDIFWVGFYDPGTGLHCNPYLIVDRDEAVLIDGGSRPDFPTVMIKILQTGLSPSSISALIYHHYDPDLCGSVPNLEDIIGRKDLRIISEKYNHMFIRHYFVSTSLQPLEDINFTFRFSSGRELLFVKTPYCHSTGSFVTFDAKSGVVFTSDIFGSYSREWTLSLELQDQCTSCSDYSNCPSGKAYCPVPDILEYHKIIMPSNKALRYAVRKINELPFSIIAPQHGSVMKNRRDINHITELLLSIDSVGIDGIPEAGEEMKK